MYRKIILSFLILSSFAFTQQYYYSSGHKIYIEQKQNCYALELNDNTTEKEVKSFLIRNKLVTPMESLNSKFILVESTGSSKEQLKSLVTPNDLVNNVRNIYIGIKGSTKFMITDKIAIKIKNESDLNMILGKYNLKEIKTEWLGDKVYLCNLIKWMSN